jgi:hypothetical protein
LQEHDAQIARPRCSVKGLIKPMTMTTRSCDVAAMGANNRQRANAALSLSSSLSHDSVTLTFVNVSE